LLLLDGLVAGAAEPDAVISRHTPPETNQYKVNPLALVSTVAPLMVVVFSADPEAA
jgi:hypothetical protein